ncbi:MAG: transposase, partial [Desulforhabdus sp.]|nr:transposase [Desulforhabdus sp.]
VHPEMKEVIPLIPEIISQQDGTTKNDCELNAGRRFLTQFHAEHPHLDIVLTHDAISPNGPYIRFVQDLGYHFIFNVKDSDHAHLFTRFDQARLKGDGGDLILEDPRRRDRYHYFHWVNGVPINASHQDVLVNLLEYWQVIGDEMIRFSWVTDIPITEANAERIMRAGRARWKIENETFNTLKNQGYNFEHNYGLGKQYLSMVFVKIMMLAFLVDQAQQLCCSLFQGALKKAGSKKALWEQMRSLFHCFKLDSMEMLYRAILHGFELREPVITRDTS